MGQELQAVGIQYDREARRVAAKVLLGADTAEGLKICKRSTEHDNSVESNVTCMHAGKLASTQSVLQHHDIRAMIHVGSSSMMLIAQSRH